MNGRLFVAFRGVNYLLCTCRVFTSIHRPNCFTPTDLPLASNCISGTKACQYILTLLYVSFISVSWVKQCHFNIILGTYVINISARNFYCHLLAILKKMNREFVFYHSTNQAKRHSMSIYRYKRVIVPYKIDFLRCICTRC